jgi:hypothetical protein
LRKNLFRRLEETKNRKIRKLFKTICLFSDQVPKLYCAQILQEGLYDYPNKSESNQKFNPAFSLSVNL